jgi:release factor glutamine methyltransferase
MSLWRRAAARIWRFGLRLRFVLFQRHRHDAAVVETLGDLTVQVLPGVFNPALFRVTPVFLEWLDEDLVPPAAAVLDVGTGTGILAIAAARTAARVTGVDRNPAAIECARINARGNGVEDRVDLRLGDLFEPVAEERFDLVLCNPPYLEGDPDGDLEHALLAGDFPVRFARDLPDHLADGARALVILSDLGEQQRFLDAFDRAGLVAEAIRRRDLISEEVTLFAVYSPSSGSRSR